MFAPLGLNGALKACSFLLELVVDSLYLEKRGLDFVATIWAMMESLLDVISTRAAVGRPKGPRRRRAPDIYLFTQWKSAKSKSPLQLSASNLSLLS
jgi:hypothetical protein